jgi:hypothetical protein
VVSLTAEPIPAFSTGRAVTIAVVAGAAVRLIPITMMVNPPARLI